MIRLLALLSLAAAGAAGAAELVLVRADPAVRPPLLWRCTVALAGEVLARPPLRLELALEADGRRLAAASLELDGPAALAAGVDAVLAPAPAPPAEARLTVRVVDAGRRLDLGLERTLPTPGALRAALERAQPAAQDPPARLRAEQAAELLQADPPDLQAMERAARLLAGDDGDPAGRALADPLDGSVQPWRLFAAPGTARRTAVLLRPGGGLRKCAWPPPPPAWLAAAAAAGCTVVEPYPAGDRDGRGILAHRAALALAAAGIPDPALVVAAPGCDGAPTARALGAGLAAGDPADPATWSAEAMPPAPAPPAQDLAGWFRRPFVVVVGTGEHLAAAIDARRLADRFAVAWARHAQGIPPVVADSAFAAERWAGHDLVLVGGPRCNAVAGRLALDLPVRWDERSIRWSGADGGREDLRSARRPVAVAAAAPGGRRVLVLDGAPAWREDGSLPLAHLPGAWAVLEPAAAASAAISR